jgi:Na+/proline symporter
MIGSVWATTYILALPEIDGISNLITHPNVLNKLSIFPDFSDPNIWVPVLLVPLAVQWWASYYPGSEPGGGGYIAQRMFSAKNEFNAVGATLLFNIAHYAIRPWPWILIALASLITFPELSDIQNRFPSLPSDKLGHDVAYPAMLTLLPSGLLGLVSASLIAAFMSTMSTQLNLGASYFVNDLYHRFLKPNALENELVLVGRVFTLLSIIMGAGLGLMLTNAGQAFELLLMIGAGTGLIYILRWFWWRINALTEIIAMISSLFVAAILNFSDIELQGWAKIVYGTIITSTVWILAAFLTAPEDEKTLKNFVEKVNPGGPGWSRFPLSETVDPWPIPKGIVMMLLGSISVYSVLIGVGQLIYGNIMTGLFVFLISIISSFGLIKIWK